MSDRIQRHALRVMTTVIIVAIAFASGTTTTLASGLTDPRDGWSIVKPATVGMNATRLDRARAYAFAPERHTQGVVVVRAGRIAAEWYAPGRGPRSWAASWSMAKSITAILVGIAIDQGKIAGVDEPMTMWIPEWKGTSRASITLRDVLEMATGLASDEDVDPAHAATSTFIGLGRARDALAYAIDRPLMAKPGTVFHYASPDAMLLSRVLEVATGERVDQYAQQVLFGPLGIEQVEWWRDGAGHSLTDCCVDSTTRNFARIGQLILDHGRWHGRQIVSREWVNEMLTGTRVSGGGYAMLWWIIHVKGINGPVYYMNGLDGQYVYLIPSEGLVVARNGDYTKSACPAIADPNLFGRYPPSGSVDGAGTRPPGDWDTGRFLRAIVRSVSGPAPRAVSPGASSPIRTRRPDGRPLAACPDPASVQGPFARSPRATPKISRPTFTG